MKVRYGVGINDADYPTRIHKELPRTGNKRIKKIVWRCPFFRAWEDMLKRCYSQALQKKNPTYKNCSVCEEWLTFSNFKMWMEKEDWRGKELDKDLLVKGNKLYSPATCVFLPHAINSFLIERDNDRGEYPLGVTWHDHNKKFRARVRYQGKDTKISYHDDAGVAHEAWKRAKCEIAISLAEEIEDPRIKNALINRYQ